MKRKWTVFYFSPCDYKGLEGYLNRRAEQGWELEKVAGIFARWRKTDRPSRWCVDVLNARADRESKLDYLDLCGEGGWTLVALLGCVAIFRSQPGEEPFPIQTDPELEKKNYNRYYLTPAILSVLYIGVLMPLLLLLSTRSFPQEQVLRELAYGWLEHWTVAALYLALPVWGLMALWKIVNFVAALIRNRKKITAPAPAMMWIHSVLVVLSLVLGVLVLAAMAADKILGNGKVVTILVLLGMYAVLLLYRAFTMERQLFVGERRRHVAAGVFCLVLLVGLIAADVALPCREWNSGWYSSNREEAAEVYKESFGYPLVHGEDVGVPFEEGESVVISHRCAPMGEWWSLEYYYGEKKVTYGNVGVGSLMVESPSVSVARKTAAALADGMDRSGFDLWPEVALEPIRIPWADEAWYYSWDIANTSGDGEILVVRVGTRVARIILPADLLMEENMETIRGELTA